MYDPHFMRAIADEHTDGLRRSADERRRVPRRKGRRRGLRALLTLHF